MEKFNNNNSMVGFIGDYSSPEEVIAQDTKELNEIGGSFEAIADRIKEILNYTERKDMGGNLNIKMDDKVEINLYLSTKGFQDCPYGCDRPYWSRVIKIRNPKTDRKLTINRGIEHLVRKHHLLEKGNEYGISAKEFYEHFM